MSVSELPHARFGKGPASRNSGCLTELRMCLCDSLRLGRLLPCLGALSQGLDTWLAYPHGWRCSTQTEYAHAFWCCGPVCGALGGVDVFMWRRVAVRACRASCGNVAVSLTVGTAGESGCRPPFRLRKLEVHPERDLWSVDLICGDVRSDRSRSLSTVFELLQKTCSG